MMNSKLCNNWQSKSCTVVNSKKKQKIDGRKTTNEDINICITCNTPVDKCKGYCNKLKIKEDNNG